MKDAENMDSKKSAEKPVERTAEKSVEKMDKSSETSTVNSSSMSESNSTSESPKKSGNSGRAILIGCVVVGVICFCLCVGGYFALSASISGSNSGPDSTLTRIKQNEVKKYEDQFKNKNLLAESVAPGAQRKLEFTEQELIAAFSGAFESETTTVEDLGIDIEPNMLKFQLKIDLNGTPIYPSAELSVAPDGRTLKLNSLTTGNSIADSLIGANSESFKQSFEKSFNESFYSEGGQSIKSISLEKDKMVITYTN